MKPVVKGTNELSIDVTPTFEDIPGLQREWETLFRSRPNEPSTSFEWTSAMARHHVGVGDQCFLLCIRRGVELVGIVPLVLRRFEVMGQRIGLLAPLSEDYNTHSDLLLAAPDQEMVDALVAALLALEPRWDCFRMARLLESNPLVPMLQAGIAARNKIYGVRGGLAAYTLDLPASYADYLAARSAKFRNHLRRAERKLLACGTVEFHTLSNREAFDAAFDALLQIERASWKQAFGSSIAAVDRQLGFYRDFCAAASGRDALHLQWMTVESRPVAYNLGYLTPSCYHYLKTSYDQDYRPLGPATVLRARLIQDLIERGIATMDFPGEPYEWETQWTTSVRRRVVLSLYAPSIRGRLLSLIDRVRHRPAATGQVAHVDPRAPRPAPAAIR